MGVISCFAFAFILQRFGSTVGGFRSFYEDMDRVCNIPLIIITLDFISNIVIGLWMMLITPFFLLQSDSIQSIVLNSFALTFVIELDDLANLFESDEDVLLYFDDLKATKLLHQGLSCKKREIEIKTGGIAALLTLVVPSYESVR